MNVMSNELTTEQKIDLVRERFEAFRRSQDYDRSQSERYKRERDTDITREDRDEPSRRR